ncbi:unnamed protein product, partial [Mesorhabditis spiculigera]
MDGIPFHWQALVESGTVIYQMILPPGVIIFVTVLLRYLIPHIFPDWHGGSAEGEESVDDNRVSVYVDLAPDTSETSDYAGRWKAGFFKRGFKKALLKKGVDPKLINITLELLDDGDVMSVTEGSDPGVEPEKPKITRLKLMLPEDAVPLVQKMQEKLTVECDKLRASAVKLDHMLTIEGTAGAEIPRDQRTARLLKLETLWHKTLRSARIELLDKSVFCASEEFEKTMPTDAIIGRILYMVPKSAAKKAMSVIWKALTCPTPETEETVAGLTLLMRGRPGKKQKEESKTDGEKPKQQPVDQKLSGNT